jgi:hypothetical protein
MHDVQSPRNDDEAIEQEIKAKGLTAPRVTPQDIADNIRNAYFFTARQGATMELVETFGPGADYKFDVLPGLADHEALGLLTFCVIVTRSGFTVTGESACASPENFDADVGKKIAFENARQKLWPLMGYELKTRLFQAQQPAQAPDPA